MPQYDYECLNKDCGHQYSELYLTFSSVEKEEPLVQCPKCSSTEKKRLISKASFSLKGGGWYADGYGNSTKKGQR